MDNSNVESVEDIWQEWQGNKLSCEGCGNRDNDLHFRAKLSTNEDADVMIIALEPNESNRTAKDASNISEIEIESYRDIELSDADYLQEVLAAYEHPEKNWPSARFIGNLIEHSKVSPEDIYLTNSKKCGNIEVGGDLSRDVIEQMNENACENCRSYLPSEIEIVDPAAVVLCGNRVVDEINTLYNLNLPESCAKNALYSERAQDREFIIAPNFGRYGAVLSQHHPEFDDQGTEKEFAKRLGESLIDSMRS